MKKKNSANKYEDSQFMKFNERSQTWTTITTGSIIRMCQNA